MISQYSEGSPENMGKSAKCYDKPKQNKAQKAGSISGLILGFRQANERLCYFVTASPIDCVQA